MQTAYTYLISRYWTSLAILTVTLAATLKVNKPFKMLLWMGFYLLGFYLLYQTSLRTKQRGDDGSVLGVIVAAATLGLPLVNLQQNTILQHDLAHAWLNYNCNVRGQIEETLTTPDQQSPIPTLRFQTKPIIDNLDGFQDLLNLRDATDAMRYVAEWDIANAFLDAYVADARTGNQTNNAHEKLLDIVTSSTVPSAKTCIDAENRAKMRP